MARPRSRRLPAPAREFYRRARARARADEEEQFRTRLRVDAEAPELLLSPHWDDAALSCWSLLARARELNVVNVFGGIPPSGNAGVWEAVLGVRDAAERAHARRVEDADALARAGRKPVNLPLLDVRYRRQAEHAVNLDELDRVLSEHVAGASRVYAPAGIGAHADHELTRRYARALLRGGMPVTLYADSPYCLLHGWPSWVDGREPAPKRDVDAYWRSFLASVPELPPLREVEVECLDAPTASAKCEALQSYEASLSYGFRRMLADPAFHAFEVRWQLDATAAVQPQDR